MDLHDPVTMLWDLALANAAFPEEYAKLKTAHPGIEVYLAQNPEVMARWWAMSLNKQIRDIGWRLYAKGGTDAMMAAREAIRNRRPFLQDLTEFTELVDTVWYGIGLTDDPRGVYELSDPTSTPAANS
jgi:hypothetical protein